MSADSNITAAMLERSGITAEMLERTGWVRCPQCFLLMWKESTRRVVDEQGVHVGTFHRPCGHVVLFDAQN